MSTINIPAILIANLIGLMILFIISVGKSWQSKKIYKEYKALRTMYICCVISCLADPICFLADGKEGIIPYILVYGCNLWMFVGNIINALAWVNLISSRIDLKIKTAQRIVVNIGAACEIVMLVINFFCPILFYVDENNVYHRLKLYWLYMVFYILVIFYGLAIYIYERSQSGNLKFFPVWAFIIPVIMGTIIQSVFYGLSTIIPFLTVSIAGIFISFQNEFIYRDKLTGLYNRFYLDLIERKIEKNTKCNYSAMMLDLNGFKHINDDFGHEAGDEALINFSNILRSVIGTRGQVIRYAGDEFIVVIATQNEDEIKRIIDSIKTEAAEFCRANKTLYQLSVSIGYCNLSSEDSSIDDYLDKIDKLMYIDKRKYYKDNPQYMREHKDI